MRRKRGGTEEVSQLRWAISAVLQRADVASREDGAAKKKSDTMIIPGTDTEINRNLISVLQWCVISHGCWARAQISADQKSKLQPTWEGEDMHLDKDATKQKDISKWKCLLPLSLSIKCTKMRPDGSSGSHHKLFLFFLIFWPISFFPAFYLITNLYPLIKKNKKNWVCLTAWPAWILEPANAWWQVRVRSDGMGLWASRARSGEAFHLCRAFYIRTIDLIPQISGCWLFSPSYSTQSSAVGLR